MSRGRSFFGFFGWGGVGRGVLAACLAALLVSSCTTTAEHAATITAGGAAEPSKQPDEPAPQDEPEDEGAPQNESQDEAAPEDDAAPQDESQDEAAPGDDAAPQDESQDEAAPGDDAAPQDEPAPGDDAAPQDEPAPGDEGAPQDEPAPGDEGAPQDEPAPEDEGVSEMLLRIAEQEGISYETAKKDLETRRLLDPYVKRIKAAASEEDFAGFWWSVDQPLTATFATAGDVEEFTRFVFDAIADLDPEVRGIFRIVQAAYSLEELRNLRAIITSVLRSQGFVFDSGTDIINGKIEFIIPPDQAGELAAAIAALADVLVDVDAEILAEAVTVKAQNLAVPDEAGVGQE